MRTLCRALLAGLLTLFAGPVPPVSAVEAHDLPPARTAAGQTNLTHIWTEKGGARLYWNTLVDPRQVRMAGARFDDPAAVPELRLAPPSVTPAPRRYRSLRKKVQARKAAPVVAAPKGVGAAALVPPVKSKAEKTATSPSAPAASAGPSAAKGASAVPVVPLSDAASLPYPAPYAAPAQTPGGGAAPAKAAAAASSPTAPDGRSAGALLPPPLTAAQPSGTTPR